MRTEAEPIYTSKKFDLSQFHLFGYFNAIFKTNLQLENTLRFLAGLTSILMLATLTFKPLHKPFKGSSSSSSSEKSNVVSQLINVDNWKNKKYVVWALAIPSALFGYFVPYVHIVSLTNL